MGLKVLVNMVGRVGVEPTTNGLRASTLSLNHSPLQTKNDAMLSISKTSVILVNKGLKQNR